MIVWVKKVASLTNRIHRNMFPKIRIYPCIEREIEEFGEYRSKLWGAVFVGNGRYYVRTGNIVGLKQLEVLLHLVCM